MVSACAEFKRDGRALCPNRSTYTTIGRNIRLVANVTNLRTQMNLKPYNSGRPKGRIPRDTKDWLTVNEKDWGWRIAVCKCGKWYDSIDDLAPYHYEFNWCSKCGYAHEQNIPEEVGGNEQMELKLKFVDKE